LAEKNKKNKKKEIKGYRSILVIFEKKIDGNKNKDNKQEHKIWLKMLFI